ncbi:MAG: hypothetical protein WAQ08_16060 [Aquabacterium sp.]|uniref:hypothetical protein n=1 Tax=Aquabacterium sp. TaxID=1872578 RepID=UPI003BAFD23F
MLTGSLRHGRKHREAMRREAMRRRRTAAERWSPEELRRFYSRGAKPLRFNMIPTAEPRDDRRQVIATRTPGQIAFEAHEACYRKISTPWDRLYAWQQQLWETVAAEVMNEAAKRTQAAEGQTWAC